MELKEPREIYVTPEWLKDRGFVQYNKEESLDVYDMPFMNEDDIHLREKNFHRNLFVVIFNESQALNAEPDDLDYLVYTQSDAGCGFVHQPLRWSGLPVDIFRAIYYSFTGLSLPE